jgi:hypothetical protein
MSGDSAGASSARAATGNKSKQSNRERSMDERLSNGGQKDEWQRKNVTGIRGSILNRRVLCQGAEPEDFAVSLFSESPAENQHQATQDAPQI